MNDFWNMGNANTALAMLNFNHHDCLADKFLHWVFCLIGEDTPEALVNNYFNEECVMDPLNKILKEIPIPNVNLPRPANMDHYFHWLVCAVHAVKVEDATAQTLVQQLQQENAGCQHRSPSPPIMIRDNADDNDFYMDTDSDDIPLDAAHNGVSNESDPDDLPKHPDNLIDDEAEEVPEGEESSPATSEQGSSGSSGSSSGSSTSGSEDSGSEGESEPSDELGAPPSLD